MKNSHVISLTQTVGYYDLGVQLLGRSKNRVKDFLDKNPKPTEGEIKKALSGNFCRCISHYEVLETVTAVIEGEKNDK